MEKHKIQILHKMQKHYKSKYNYHLTENQHSKSRMDCLMCGNEIVFNGGYVDQQYSEIPHFSKRTQSTLEGMF